MAPEDGIDVFGGRVAQSYYELKIYGARGNHIVTLHLHRREGMTDGDAAQMQNFLWTQVGYAIRESKELQDILRHGGIEVFLEDPNPEPEAAPSAN